MKKPKVKICISLLNDGGVLIVTRADAELGALHDCLDVWDDVRDYVAGAFCPCHAREYLLPLLGRPFGLHRGDDDYMVVLNTLHERQALLDRLVAHVH